MKKQRTYKQNQGYLRVKSPNHPHNSYGFIYQHKDVMEKHLGCIIDSNVYHIHHIDHNRANNSIENLLLVKKEDHKRIDCGWKVIDGEWYKPCIDCKELLLLSSNNYYFRRATGRPLSMCKECVKIRGLKRKGEFTSYGNCIICEKPYKKTFFRKSKCCSRLCGLKNYYNQKETKK